MGRRNADGGGSGGIAVRPEGFRNPSGGVSNGLRKGSATTPARARDTRARFLMGLLGSGSNVSSLVNQDRFASKTSDRSGDLASGSLPRTRAPAPLSESTGLALRLPVFRRGQRGLPFVNRSDSGRWFETIPTHAAASKDVTTCMFAGFVLGGTMRAFGTQPTDRARGGFDAEIGAVRPSPRRRQGSGRPWVPELCPIRHADGRSGAVWCVGWDGTAGRRLGACFFAVVKIFAGDVRVPRPAVTCMDPDVTSTQHASRL